MKYKLIKLGRKSTRRLQLRLYSDGFGDSSVAKLDDLTLVTTNTSICLSITVF